MRNYMRELCYQSYKLANFRLLGVHIQLETHVNMIRRQIFVLSGDNAKNHDSRMLATVKKSGCGIKLEPMVSIRERTYVSMLSHCNRQWTNPHSYCEKVEHNQIKLH